MVVQGAGVSVLSALSVMRSSRRAGCWSPYGRDEAAADYLPGAPRGVGDRQRCVEKLFFVLCTGYYHY